MRRFAIIGNGFIAPRHFEAISRVGGVVTAVCDTDPSKAVKGIPFYEDYRNIPLKDFDWAVVCTPNVVHLEVAAWALSNFKKVLAEKPLAIAASDLKPFLNDTDLYTVLQLRHHPLWAELKAIQVESASLHVRVKRGADYWKGWKGDEKQSGGILFNLGVHYFDALLQMFGPSYRVVGAKVGEREAEGVLAWGMKEVPWHISISDSPEGQDRYLMVNGEKFRFSDKDNLSFEDLHWHVYQDMLEGKGVRPKDVWTVTKLIEDIKGYGA